MRYAALRLSLLALLLVSGVGVLGAAIALPRRAALSTLLAFQDSVPEDLEADAPSPEHFSWVTDPAGFGFERVWWARAATGRPAPVLLLVIGAGKVGIRDGRVLRAVDAFRRAGFDVLAPEVPMLANPGQPDNDAARMGVLLQRVLGGELPGCAPGRVGVAGVSVGASFALSALLDHLEGGGVPPLAFLGIGMPYDLWSASESWFALPLPADEGVAHPDFPQRDGAVFARSFLWRAALPCRVHDKADQESLRTWLSTDNRPRVVPDQLRSAEGRAFGAMVIQGPERWLEERTAMLAQAEANLALLSPARHLLRFPQVRGIPFFLLHGVADPQVPVGHGVELERALAQHTVAVLLKSHMIAHTQVEGVGPTEAIAHLTFMDDFLESVR